MASSGALARVADHVIAVFPREGLSAALAATHRAGFGPNTRVFDGARSDVTRQLERAGLRLIDSDEPRGDALLIVVTAPGRTAPLADLFHRLGAETVMLAARRGSPRPVQAQPPLLAPDFRLENDAERVADA